MMFSQVFSAVLLALPFTLAQEERPEYTLCGAPGMEPCAEGLQCIDNPYRPASRSCGMSCDVPGICVPQTPSDSAPGSGAGARCGGLEGSTCGDGLKCVQVQGDDGDDDGDDDDDDNNDDNDGDDEFCNDCVGICV
ncbi:hypothetical protein MAPG_07424 [Magnaporthiopsis poae ATCC 64411]|uniref:Uncharacterized protein n=1 Tax=Magnaporthiopsis poae (strain ATCC 64411 / 73-15) TaxID=644358 RepID=A0A0C4E4M7_MAGP6|nr:hypothetical protein MAPG_07424 [Magnaporthiopsis poae ATCC 64411]